MIAFYCFLIAAAAVWALAYLGAALPIWTLAVAVYWVALYFAGAIGLGGIIAAGILTVLPLVLLNIPPLRRMLTEPIFELFKKILPPMSDTERDALEAGDVWWEGEMFRGKPKWRKLLDFQRTRLTDEEQSFLDNEVNELCRMLDDWKILQEDLDIPQEAWDYIREKGFFTMLIPREHGGLGFSAYAQSCVVTKIATRSVTASVTVMVPNSLGPGELLVHYGTKEQQKKWLPVLADSSETPCFGLTSEEVGSDASKLTDTGIVCRGEYEGREMVGIRLNFYKRYITLAPVATVIGLAFMLHDPDGLLGDKDKSDYGITCALLPADTPGVEIGRRHYPGSAFMNGPIKGQDVFIPLDSIIGGVERAGDGWRMLTECLSAGRGISLPALATAAGKAAYRATGAYSRIRRQFNTEIGNFEGVQELTSRIAGLTYKLEAMRTLTASGVDHCTPAVVTGIAKYHMTEMMRDVVIDAMDVHSGRGVIMGPRNYLQGAYQSLPVGITVEGANVLTRSLMIFGQGSIRCHPYVFTEMETTRNDDLKGFDKAFWKHIGFSINRGVRSFTLALTGSRLARSPVSGPTARYYRQLARMSSVLAFTSDVAMGVLGGDLKRKEMLSARLGDVLSHLYIASAVLKYHYDAGEPEEDLDHVRWAVEDSLAIMGEAFDGFLRNFPNPAIGTFLRIMTFPFGNPHSRPSDELGGRLGNALMEKTGTRERLTGDIYFENTQDDPLGRLELALDKLLVVEEPYRRFTKASGKGKLDGFTTEDQLRSAVAKDIISDAESREILEYDKLRVDVIRVDDFSKEYLAGLKQKGEDAGRSRVA